MASSSSPRLPLPVLREETDAFGESPPGYGDLSPAAGGHSPTSPPVLDRTDLPREIFPEPLVSRPAAESEEEVQGFGALLAGRYRPGSDWTPDPLPTDPPADTVVG